MRPLCTMSCDLCVLCHATFVYYVMRSLCTMSCDKIIELPCDLTCHKILVKCLQQTNLAYDKLLYYAHHCDVKNNDLLLF